MSPLVVSFIIRTFVLGVTHPCGGMDIFPGEVNLLLIYLLV
jgi:hypothetical protein